MGIGLPSIDFTHQKHIVPSKKKYDKCNVQLNLRYDLIIGDPYPRWLFDSSNQTDRYCTYADPIVSLTLSQHCPQNKVALKIFGS